MSKLLYVKASPLGAGSKSPIVADANLAVLRAGAPSITIDTLDLAVDRIPEFDCAKVAAKLTTDARRRRGTRSPSRPTDSSLPITS